VTNAQFRYVLDITEPCPHAVGRRLRVRLFGQTARLPIRTSPAARSAGPMAPWCAPFPRRRHHPRRVPRRLCSKTRISIASRARGKRPLREHAKDSIPPGASGFSGVSAALKLFADDGRCTVPLLSDFRRAYRDSFSPSARHVQLSVDRGRGHKSRRQL
jgi:hypothetical protein